MFLDQVPTLLLAEVLKKLSEKVEENAVICLQESSGGFWWFGAWGLGFGV